jgi:hypothetical protein
MFSHAVATIEDRLEFLEDVTILRSCHELAQYGVNKSAMYNIDPDGKLTGEPPILAYCNFEDGSTEIMHSMTGLQTVEKCGTHDCFQLNITYQVPMSQLEALKDVSETCQQVVEYECQSAVLRAGSVDVAHWIDNKGWFVFLFVSIVCLLLMLPPLGNAG